MNQAFEFLIHHGYTVLFLWVFAEQLGVPFPALLGDFVNCFLAYWARDPWD